MKADNKAHSNNCDNNRLLFDEHIVGPLVRKILAISLFSCSLCGLAFVAPSLGRSNSTSGI